MSLTPLLGGIAAMLGLAAWAWLWPWPAHDPALALVTVRSAVAAVLLRWGYAACWILTPYFLVLLGATVGGLLLERRGRKPAAVPLPPWPHGDDPQIVIGEVHRRTQPGQGERPGWLAIGRRGLYAGTAVFGAVGSGKTSCCMYPFARQVLGWHADRDELRPGGLVLEVKGDFCHQVRRILRDHGRADDYVELGLDGDWCYNPLQCDLDAYSLAYQIATLLNQLFGKGKEPFWQQAYTNLVKFVILLFRVCDGYVTLQDVYRTALDDASLRRKIDEARERLDFAAEARLDVEQYSKHEPTLPDRQWEYEESTGEWYVQADPKLLEVFEERKVKFELREPEPADSDQRQLQTVVTWYQNDWSQLDTRLRSSITEGVSVFLSLFDQPEVADVFCPPRHVYSGGDPHRGRWALPPLAEALEEGKVVALNLPIGANPALGRAIGVMLKQDFQRSVLGRIPRMAEDPQRAWRDIAFICDEYQHFATVGESDPGGDEKFFSLSRQARLVALVATQSVSSLRSAMPGESWRTLLQTFRTRVFLTLADEASCKQASEACGQVERLKEQYSISESSQSGVGLLSGRAGGGKGTFGVTKSYSLRREPVFQPSAFAELRNAQAIVAAYDGRNPLPPTYCYLKPWYLPVGLGYFEAVDDGKL
ncbi:MAG: TraM recognition domain-containing protein [Acidobacteriia bacterium]|nr:TraM recognition domain-containing protein [Terriglobia bacterium]MYG00762.1 TraM recognition domain-containing protein [Terriglobia bacterium]MYK12061.1 TraM recognition domain-containing protein [Terriglobia bacterium]